MSSVKLSDRFASCCLSRLAGIARQAEDEPWNPDGVADGAMSNLAEVIRQFPIYATTAMTSKTPSPRMTRSVF